MKRDQQALSLESNTLTNMTIQVERTISISPFQANSEKMKKTLLTKKAQKKPIRTQQANPTKYTACLKNL